MLTCFGQRMWVFQVPAEALNVFVWLGLPDWISELHDMDRVAADLQLAHNVSGKSTFTI